MATTKPHLEISYNSSLSGGKSILNQREFKKLLAVNASAGARFRLDKRKPKE